MPKIKKGFVIRLYPNQAQMQQIRRTAGCSRWLYNQILAMNDSRKELDQSAPFLFDRKLNYLLPCLKEEHPWLKEVDSTSLTGVVDNISNAYKRWLSGKSKRPKFKKKSAYQQSYVSKCVNNNIVLIDANHIKLPKLGVIRFKAGELPHGRICSATVSLKASGKVCASVLCEYDEVELPKTGEKVGIDLGLKDLAILSDGTKYELPRWDKESAARLHYWQRIASRRLLRAKEAMKEDDSLRLTDCKNYQRARQMVAKICEHIANQRRDYLEKLSTMLVTRYDVIVVENLIVRNMMHNHKLAGAISNASWGMFAQMLAYKCAFYGKQLITVDPAHTSQVCSECGYVNNRLGYNSYGWLKVREWTCPVCEAHHDRDVNAAINILNAGMIVA